MSSSLVCRIDFWSNFTKAMKWCLACFHEGVQMNSKTCRLWWVLSAKIGLLCVFWRQKTNWGCFHIWKWFPFWIRPFHADFRIAASNRSNHFSLIAAFTHRSWKQDSSVLISPERDEIIIHILMLISSKIGFPDPYYITDLDHKRL